MLFHANSPLYFWVKALSTALYIINRLPKPILNEVSPFKILYGKTPNVMFPHLAACAFHICVTMLNKNLNQEVFLAFFLDTILSI
jgi:hypothetical protein